MHHVLMLSICALCALTAAPALASVSVVPVAEPGSLTLLAVAAAAGVLLHRFHKEK